MNNIILTTDSYKFSHGFQYLPDTQGVYSYYESRKGSQYPYTVFYGLQCILKKHLEGVVVTREKVDEAERLITMHLGEGMFDRKKWDYIIEKHGGRLPVRIKAVKEGSVVPVSNALLTVENTDDNCAWLTNFIETVLTHVWYPMTVATRSRFTKEMITRFHEETADDLSGIPFTLHDFGARGVETVDAAAIGGSAHLLNFLGTDTVAALTVPKEWYGEDGDYIAGFSVRATEHSVMTSRGEEGEFDVVQSLLDRNPDGILAMVIDSYDYKRFIETCGTRFHDQIMGRDGRIVFRPDSGDVAEVSQTVLELLGKHFGYTVNSKGYKVLPPQVRALWGDGIEYEGVKMILELSKKNGWSAENWIFGMGGGLLQKMNRDVIRGAFKCSSQKYGDSWHDVWKKPLDLSKASKRGRLAVVEREGTVNTIREEELAPGETNLLETVFENGTLVREQKFSEIRERCALK